MNNFWDGFEKRAILWRPGKDAASFGELGKRLASNRAKNMGVEISHHVPSGLLSRLGRTVRGWEAERLAKKMGINPMKALGRGGVDRKIMKKNFRAAEVRRIGAHSEGDRIFLTHKDMRQKDLPLTIHHELDEVALGEKLGPLKMKEGGKVFFKSFFSKSPLKVLSNYRFSKGYTSHISPEVILRESNNVFHGSTPEASALSKNIRTQTWELPHLKEHGLRYGEEYIPEGGRRWNRLVKKLEGKRPLEDIKKKSLYERNQELLSAGKQKEPMFDTYKNRAANLKSLSPAQRRKVVQVRSYLKE